MIEKKFTFGDSRKFANVHIFEALKKELDARVMEISGMMSSKKKNSTFFVFASRFYTRRL